MNVPFSSVKKAFLMSVAMFSVVMGGYAKDQIQRNEVAVQAYADLEVAGMPFLHFKTFGKYPYMVKFDPRSSMVEILLCGSYNAEKSAVEINSSADALATITPVRHMIKCTEGGYQIDKKLPGYRETVLGAIFETVGKFVGLLPKSEYKGKMLVDEYLHRDTDVKNGIPMKWVLRDADDFRGIREYMSREFEKRGVVPGNNKPLLLLQITNNSQLSAEDQKFLSDFFVLADARDSKIKTFFGDADKALGDAFDATKDAKRVLENFGEITFRELEEQYKEFEVKKMAAAATKYLLVGVTAAVTWKIIDTWIKSKVEDPTRRNLESNVAKLAEAVKALTGRVTPADA